MKRIFGRGIERMMERRICRIGRTIERIIERRMAQQFGRRIGRRNVKMIERMNWRNGSRK